MRSVREPRSREARGAVDVGLWEGGEADAVCEAGADRRYRGGDVVWFCDENDGWGGWGEGTTIGVGGDGDVENCLFVSEHLRRGGRGDEVGIAVSTGDSGGGRVHTVWRGRSIVDDRLLVGRHGVQRLLRRRLCRSRLGRGF